MEDSVKFIFKTLIKVPIIIVVSFLIFNIFAFAVSYTRLLSFSYIVMQVATENNYIPNSEKDMLENYASGLETAIMPEVRVMYNRVGNADESTILGDKLDNSINSAYPDDSGSRRQYGKAVRVGVAGRIVLMFPLTTKETLQNVDAGVNGFNGGNGVDNSIADEATLQRRREAKKSDFWISIMYTVPGLQYYPDL